MSTETATARSTDTTPGSWKGGVVAGLAGGIPFCIVLSIWFAPFLREALPAMFGLDGGIVGWILQASLAAVFGVVFAAVVGALDWGDDVGRSVGLGTAYGAILWIVNFGFVFPLWLRAVDLPSMATLVSFDLVALVGYLVYGAVLGAVYPYVNRI